MDTLKDASKPVRRRCPLCTKAAVARYRPFCSRRCADIDLGRWLNGAYAIPATDEDIFDEPDAAGEGECSGRGD